MEMRDVSNLLKADGLSVFDGYAKTGAPPPYIVNRPLILDHEAITLSGDAIDWDFRYSLYCVAASVEASFNLAIRAIKVLQGKRVGGSTLTCSMGYTGAQVESRYESQVTIQINQGGL